ncbi:DUF2244 domain-containing protein [Piscinibacter koreensis]|uniref:DUF2244 domain-containing protein n=1 Tax=Piscinibacter koreensis TaxID=2742824 RepID=A0A7Y6TXH0_9BURK|nr:DUF2244 domain-containing protein [Schlegelella koreensis]NUZ07041.1 DUF2244 domain-containing protein [Schlegelella koreensis]
MSALSSHAPRGFAPAPAPLRFGRESASGDGSVEWLLKRNCSIAPRQLLMFYLSLSALSLAIATFFWVRGAPLVMPFAGIEILSVGAALLVYARHATDRERVRLATDVLTVECTIGLHTVAVELSPNWVRVEPEHGDRSWIELSDRGRRITIGRFIRPEHRRAFASELRWALRRWQYESRAAC